MVGLLVYGFVVYSVYAWWMYLSGMMHDSASRDNHRRHFSRPGMRMWAEDGTVRVESTGDDRDHSERCQSSLSEWFNVDKPWVDWWPLRWCMNVAALFVFLHFI